STTQNLFAISSSTSEVATVVGDSGRILRTQSAGEYWTRFYTTPATQSEYFLSVSSPDSLNSYICGQKNVYKTTDGGFSWLPIQISVTDLAEWRGQSISFGDSLHGGLTYTDKYNRGYTRCSANGGITFDMV